jgi:hypothetical protein
VVAAGFLRTWVLGAVKPSGRIHRTRHECAVNYEVVDAYGRELGASLAPGTSSPAPSTSKAQSPARSESGWRSARIR